ncbi:Mitochondrial distribution and morphology protein 10 [Tieghemiomyces parasiticus]|uniref:Mitochondrial distribution and morphology protein 10 n=1 Tax=Tieghemiomyces parasiticus TaxID=78921 RepID=A0A9W8AFB9_9FUNG|nr:Mitochondrial distribution and morphology protein 10 [Tieghemiomyces parasiticus]
MHDYLHYCLRQFNRSTRWNDDNQYSNLSAASRAILDFTPPNGFTFLVSKAPTAYFKSSYLLQTYPLFSGSLGYLFTSEELNLAKPVLSTSLANDKVGTSTSPLETTPNSALPQAGPDSTNLLRSLARDATRLDQDDVLGGLLGTCQVGAWNPVLHQPSPEPPLKTAGQYLLCGKVFIPTWRIEALFSRQLTRRTRFLTASVNQRGGTDGEFLAQLQYDCTKWCTELSLSAPSSLLGLRGLYNFGAVHENPTLTDLRANPGRICVGGELYYSTEASTGGLSVGIRYRTLFPKTAEFTCVTNPVMGHVSTAYTASITPTCIMSNRFDFNVYSLHSDLTTGVEWHNSPTSIVKASASATNGLMLALNCRYRKVLLSMGATLGYDSLKRYGRQMTGMSAGAVGPSSPLRSLGVHVQFFS